VCTGANICGYPCSCRPIGPPAVDAAQAADLASSPADMACSYRCCPPCATNQTCCVGVPFVTPTCFNGTVCPISRRAQKTDVEYLGPDELERLRDQLMKFRLATWRYRPGVSDESRHLGFIIDDVEPSQAVGPDGQTVDLYGYASMAVASLQAQARQIAALEKEVRALKRQLRSRR
jgi:hypothetical protein